MSRSRRVTMPATKRITDLALVLSTIWLWVPLVLFIGLALLLVQGSPVLFRQKRIGRHGRPFTMVKFRTMTESRARDGSLLADGARLTDVGRWLRATSLDELPELVHVMRGQMSLVGPRPLLPEYLPRYSARHARRHEVAPGITGWAQVNGRNAIDWAERLDLDVWYVDHWSWSLDLLILTKTGSLIVSRRGVTADGEATVRRLEETDSKRP